MRVPFSYLDQQFQSPELLIDSIRDVVRRGDFTLGSEVEKFEKAYAELIGASECIAVGSGTEAIALSLYVMGVSAGDEVITAANTFVATVGAIVQRGARPVFVDCDETLCLDPNQLDKALTKKTKAIVPVHWAGQSADIEAITEWAKSRGIAIVEDACQAMGAIVSLDDSEKIPPIERVSHRNRKVGTWGDAGAFSLHPLKPLHVWGDSGVIATNRPELAQRLKRIRNHGMEGRDTVVEYGFNSRMDTVQAAIGIHLIEEAKFAIQKRIENAAYLDAGLNALVRTGRIGLPRREQRRGHVYHLYQLFTERRDALVSFLCENQIEAKVHYPIPLHLQPASKFLSYRQGDFPMTEKQSRFSLTLPSHQYLSREQLDFLVDTIERFFS